MRLPMAGLALLAAFPAFSQGTERHWYLDLHRFTPSLTGHFQGTSNNQPISVDLRDDLALEKDKAKLGFGAEYQGPRFGLEFSRDEEDYAGQKQVTRAIIINGQTFNANTVVSSKVKATNSTLNWTIRAFRWPQFWLGIDLGARATEVQIDSTGVQPFSGVTATASYKTTLPIPQIGPSLGFTAFDGRLVGKGMFHLLGYKGCSYTHSGADLRYFPISWLGVRAYFDHEHVRVPKGSIKDDLDILMDRNGTGFGLVARF